MENEKRQDLKISGSGTSNGGVFDEVQISGSGKVTGDIDCFRFNTSGFSRVSGSVKTKDFKISGGTVIDGSVVANYMTISGTSEINGSITAENMTVSGTSKVRGDSTLKKIKVSGTTCIDGNLKSEEVSVSGSIDIGKDCEAENFTARGGFNIGGLLNAGNIEIHIGGSCRAKEIGGEKIDARQLGGGAFIWNSIMNFFSSHGGRLTAEVIEGDNIYLEYTLAKVVRGNNIQIGPECVIDLVEYRNELNVNSGSTVREQKKI